MREWSVAAFPPKPDLPESGNHISRLPIRLLYHDAGQRICPQVVAMQLCPLAVEKTQGAQQQGHHRPQSSSASRFTAGASGFASRVPGLWCECNILTESARLPVSVIEHAGFSLPRVILASRSIQFRGLGHVPLRGRQTVSDYSIYVLFDEERVLSDCRTTINCADDEEAIRVAKQWVDLHDVELWQSNRFITRFTPLSEHITLTGFRA